MKTKIATECKTLLQENERIKASRAFIEKNQLSLINKERLEDLFCQSDDDDLFGFKKEVLCFFISKESFENPKIREQFKPEFDPSIIKPITDIQEAAQDFLDYMVFAWSKSMGQRGISASRSIMKLSTWLRVMNREDLALILEDDGNYHPYGAPALIKVCEKMGIDYPKELLDFSLNKV